MGTTPPPPPIGTKGVAVGAEVTEMFLVWLDGTWSDLVDVTTRENVPLVEYAWLSVKLPSVPVVI